MPFADQSCSVTVGVVRWACDGRTFTLGHLSHTLIPSLDHFTTRTMGETQFDIDARVLPFAECKFERFVAIAR